MSRGRMARHAIALVAIASNAAAFTRNEATWAASRIPVVYKVNASSAPSSIGGGAGLRAVDDGFARWAAPACTAWSTRNGGSSAVTRPSATDGENSVLWITGLSGSWPAELGAEDATIGITTSTFVRGGNLTDADIALNAVGFVWGDGARGTVDAQSVITHEEGHFLGLGHSSVAGAVMVATYSSGQVRNLSADDQSGVCSLYPAGSLDAGAPDSGSGLATFGAACTAPNQCASGLCIGTSGGGGVCSANCTDDCACPTNFVCAPLVGGGRVCAPGTNRCVLDAGPQDAGPPDAGRDAGVDAGFDAGSDAGMDASVRDAAADANVRPGDASGSREAGARDWRDPVVVGCACSVVGTRAPLPPGPVASALLAGLALLRRRRPRDPR